MRQMLISCPVLGGKEALGGGSYESGFALMADLIEYLMAVQ